jgi:hypothetical protein
VTKIKSHSTVEGIARKHRLEVSFVKRQLKMGIPIEHEHTKDRDLAMDIALQHLDEIPDYYTRLKKMESNAKKDHEKFKDMKEHCGCEDDAVRELEISLKKLNNTSYDSIDALMRRIMRRHDLTAKQLHNAFVNKHDKTPDDWIKNLKEGTLHHWFKGSRSNDGKPGWVQADGSPCANEPGETKTPKCFSSGRLSALKRKGKKGESLIRSAVRRKRNKDKKQQAKTGGAKPTMVSTFAKGKKDPNYVKAEPGIKESMELNEATKDNPGKGSGKKDACYYKVKSRYDVWPSAYASGALVKCRKAGAKNWGTKTEEVQAMRYCPKCQKDETRDECKYGPKFWDMYSMPIKLRSYTPNTPHPGNFPESYDHEHSMARSELSTIVSAAKRLRKKLKGEGNLEAWVQSKITKAADYIDTAADYIDSGEMKENYEQQSIFNESNNYNITYTIVGKTFEQFINESWEEKIKKMSPQQIEDLKKSNPGASEKIDSMLKKIKSATPNPVGSGPQLPSVTSQSPQRSRPQSSQASQDSQPSQMFSSREEAIKYGQRIKREAQRRRRQRKRQPAVFRIISRIYRNLRKKRTQNEEYSNWRQELFESTPAWQRKEGKRESGGLNQKGVESYRREHPGSKLKTAVTTKPSKLKKGSKSWNRRKSFCSRMSGMKAKLTSAKTARDPNSRINKSLRAWNC